MTRAPGPILAFAGWVFLAGCALPGSSLTRVTVSGSLVDADDTPVPGAAVSLVLPSGYGLRGLDALRGEPSLYGHGDQRILSVTGEDGRFEADFEPVTYSLVFWLIPPLGASFQGPPDPIVFLRVGPREAPAFRVVADGETIAAEAYGPDGRLAPDAPTGLRITGRVENVEEEEPPGPPGGHRLILRLRRERP